MPASRAVQKGLFYNLLWSERQQTVPFIAIYVQFPTLIAKWHACLKEMIGSILAEPRKNIVMKDDKPIITEDGQRLTIDNGQITGTEDPGPGLAFETGNVMDENNKPGGSCPVDNPEQKSGANKR